MTADAGWHIERLVSTLRVGEEPRELVEDWRIVAEVTLDELVVEIGVQLVGSLPSGLFVTYGGELVDEAWPPGKAGRKLVTLRLPGPLLPGQSHEFGLTVQGGSPHPLAEHVHVPTVRCDLLVLRARFAPGPPPATVWLLDGVDLLDRARCATGVRSVPVDEAGEAVARFQGLRAGLGYGLDWIIA